MMPENSTQPAAASDYRRWLLEHVCPFWFERVMDPMGGFYEALDAASNAIQLPERTILNQARLTYVASHAYLMGADARMLSAARHGMAYLQKAVAGAGSAAGWPRRLSCAGDVMDPARDAYDHAFIIFAMAWYFRATADTRALELARHAYDFMINYMADPVGGGFFEEYPDTAKLPRRQNPHMHLLEAVLAMYESTRDGFWLTQSHLLVRLFRERLTDKDTGAVIEYFKRDWSPADGDAGSLREPGHQFEWVWLLGQYTSLSGEGHVARAANRLMSFGCKFGIDKGDQLGGAVLDGVDRHGAIVADTKLFWPQTEYIKACIQQSRCDPGEPWLERASAHMQLLLQHYFKADSANWCNQLSRAGLPMVDITPSRVLYHLFLATSELIHAGENP